MPLKNMWYLIENNCVVNLFFFPFDTQIFLKEVEKLWKYLFSQFKSRETDTACAHIFNLSVLLYIAG